MCFFEGLNRICFLTPNIIDFQWSGYFQQDELLCQMCGVGMLFISLKNTCNSKKFINGMIFDATIYGGQLCSHNYVKENEN